jgi:hypothetical protein
VTCAEAAAYGQATCPGDRRPYSDLWEAVEWLLEHQQALDLAAQLPPPGPLTSGRPYSCTPKTPEDGPFPALAVYRR